MLIGALHIWSAALIYWPWILSLTMHLPSGRPPSFTGHGFCRQPCTCHLVGRPHFMASTDRV
jgi:hypothetical protein